MLVCRLQLYCFQFSLWLLGKVDSLSLGEKNGLLDSLLRDSFSAAQFCIKALPAL
jgi:hypothetical protein